MTSRILTNIARVARRKCVTLETRTFVTATNTLLEKHTIKVPTMGDSITEGTIVEWVASIGQMVKEEDVVALIETDKVTVDIKAKISGVLTQQFGAVDDTVEVGASLYEIDTEAEATAVASEAPAAAAAAAPAEKPAKTESAPAAVAASSSSSSESGHRTPSIKFLGKEGWELRRSGAEEHEQPQQQQQQQSASPILYAIPPDYGRPVFTDAEMEALVMGGANLVPDVKSYSSGAKFGF